MSLEERKSKVGGPTEEEVQSEKKYLMIETIVFFIGMLCQLLFPQTALFAATLCSSRQIVVVWSVEWCCLGV